MAQLAEGGIIVAPVGRSRTGQDLVVGRKAGDRLITREGVGCIFVLLGGAEGGAA